MSIFTGEEPILGLTVIEAAHPSGLALVIQDPITKIQYFAINAKGGVVPAGTLTKTDQTASLAATDLVASANAALYKITYGVNVHTAGASGTATVVVGYTDAATGLASTATSAAFSLATANDGFGGSLVVNALAGSAITLAVTWSTAGAYDVYALCEQF